MSERFAWIFDKQKQKKIWCADMWARKAVLAIRTAITGITSRLTTIEGAGYQTASDVSAAIAAAIGGITELEYLVVSTLPASGTKGVIYLVPHQHGTRDIYDEYIWVNNSFEKIGNTDVDLSGYLKDTDISAWAKASTKPTYTASEVGALSDSTVIPGASSATPSMDGTGAAGSSADYARADHVHPSDTAKQDALTAEQLAAVNSGITSEYVLSKFAVITCTLASSNTYGAFTALPTGFTKDTCVMLVIQVPDGSGERIGQGIFTTTNMRLFAEMTTSGVRIYSNTSRYYGATAKVVLMRTDI